jgi:uncharacterized protein YggE
MLIAAVLGLAVAARAAEFKPGEIKAQGTATVYVMPDKAVLQFTAQAQDAQLAHARELSATATATVISAIQALKIDKLTLKTTAVDVTPLYEPLKPGEQAWDQTVRKILAYRVANTVAVTVKSDDPDALKDAVSRVIDAALLNGANGLSGPSFSKEDERAARREALQQATQEAALNAQAMAQGLGVKITRYTYVSMLNPTAPGPVFGEARMMNAMAAPGGGGATPSPVEIEALPVAATVYVDAEY